MHRAGDALGLARLPLEQRIVIVALGMFPLFAADLRAIARSSYCPISWRRQTPRTLLREHRFEVAASIWGFDTGLVVTTFRVAAISWGALLFAAIGFAPRWSGVAYGLGFTLPFLLLLFRPQLGRAAQGADHADPGLESLLGKRALMQRLSAVLLIGSGVVLFATILR